MNKLSRRIRRILLRNELVLKLKKLDLEESLNVKLIVAKYTYIFGGQRGMVFIFFSKTNTNIAL